MQRFFLLIFKFSPYSSASAHTRTEWLDTTVSRKKIVVVVTKVFCFSVHVGEVLLIDSVPLCSVAHFFSLQHADLIKLSHQNEFQKLMKYASYILLLNNRDRLIHFVI